MEIAWLVTVADPEVLKWGELHLLMGPVSAYLSHSVHVHELPWRSGGESTQGLVLVPCKPCRKGGERVFHDVRPSTPVYYIPSL